MMLQNVMDESSPYAVAYKYMHEIEQEEQRSEKFPKEFREQTNENVNGYPAYRRRNNGRTVTVGRYVVDNRYVVMYIFLKSTEPI